MEAALHSPGNSNSPERERIGCLQTFRASQERTHSGNTAKEQSPACPLYTCSRWCSCHPPNMPLRGQVSRSQHSSIYHFSQTRIWSGDSAPSAKMDRWRLRWEVHSISIRTFQPRVAVSEAACKMPL